MHSRGASIESQFDYLDKLTETWTEEYKESLHLKRMLDILQDPMVARIIHELAPKQKILSREAMIQNIEDLIPQIRRHFGKVQVGWLLRASLGLILKDCLDKVKQN